MKRIFQLSVVVLLIGVGHQASAQAQLALGLKGGLNFARLDGRSSITADYGSRSGYHFGAYALIKIAKVGIQPEIIFSRQGQTFSFTYPGTRNTRADLVSNFDYVNIPIMIKWYLLAGLNLQVGPQFGFLINSKGDMVSSNGQGGVQVTDNQDLKQFVKSSDLSLGFGLGWDLPLGINIGARYNLGLSDVNKLSGQGSSSQISSMGYQKAKNQVIQFSIGYRIFKIGK